MSQRVEEVSKWFYRGVWGVLTGWFRVPDRPPTLPVLGGEKIDAFQPDPGFLRYLKVLFWIPLIAFELGISVGWLVLLVAVPIAGLVAAPLVLVLLVAPVAVGYLALHLRYDTTWYVMTDRSLRIRRGIWIIHETTITFENVQNVSVNQGPLQRLFGISNVLVQTAGGGSGGHPHGAHGGGSMGAHQGLIEGIADALRIRNAILQRLKRSRSAGLGDEADTPGLHGPGPHGPGPHATPSGGPRLHAEHLVVLREIRDALKAG